MDAQLPVNILIGAAEIPLLIILIVSGLAAYFKSKDTAIKYALIAFPAIMFLNLLALIVSAVLPHNNSVQEFLGPANNILTIVVFIGCLVALETAVRWYLKSRGPASLCLMISFGLYALSSFLIFLYTYFGIDGNVVPLAAMITGVVAYLAGISAMILALLPASVVGAD